MEIPMKFRALLLLFFLSLLSTGACANILFDSSKHFAAPSAPKSLSCTGQSNQVACVWFDPAANGSQITDYVIQSDCGGAGYVTFADGTSTDTVATVTSLTNGISCDFRVSATNSIGTGSYSATDSATPTGSPETELGDLISNVVACWHGDTYTGSGDWLDKETGSTYDVTPSDTSLHNGDDAWVMDNSGNFDIGTNPTFVANMGKTTGGTDWTVLARVKTPPASQQLDSLLGTADDNLDYGIVIRVDSSGNLKLDQYDGTTKVTQQHATSLGTAAVQNIGIRYTNSTDTIGWAVGEDTWSTESGGWTASTTAATDPLKLASEGGGNADMETDAEIYAICLLDNDISDADLATAKRMA